LALATSLASRAFAGPPYVTDDPETTPYRHYEIYLFAQGGTSGVSGTSGEAGVDFNYGAGRDLQLTAVVPLGYVVAPQGGTAASFGRAELAAKFRLLHQDASGVDLAIFPRVFLPAGSARVGDRHGTYLLPLWLEKDWEPWSVFGGGGCALNRGGGSQDFCLASVALTRQVSDALALGAEVAHQTADTKGGKAASVLGFGASYDFSETYHLLASVNRSLDSVPENATFSWYAAVLFTF